MDGLDVVLERVRERVRDDGVDPVLESGAVRAIVSAVLDEYAAESADGDLPRLRDTDAVTRRVLDSVSGFGALQRWLDDPGVEEIWIKYRLTPA